MKHVLWFVVLLMFTGCAGDVTELVIVVDSDLAVPEALDQIEIIVDASEIGGQEERLGASLEGDTAEMLPVSLGVLHTGGPLGPLRVAAIGRSLGAEVVRRDAVASFVEGEIRVLRLDLLRSCVDVECGEEETCATGVCRPVLTEAVELQPWTGMANPIDVGPCTVSPEVCNGDDDDCDGGIDEGLGLEIDPMNCGVCGNTCPAAVPNGLPLGCVGGGCAAMCDDGWFDCDGNTGNGCETQLADLDNCGACGASCAFPQATTACGAGVCEIVACDAGRSDCDLLQDNGCESTLADLDNCGACGVPCGLANAVASCGTGTCELASCEPGFDDCDGNAANGCEVELATSLDHCGVCGNACAVDPLNASSGCDMGSCVLSCDPGFEDCNDEVDGCEADLGSPGSCGNCTTMCPPGTPLCDGAACRLDCPPGAPTQCGSECVDLMTDVRHCGSCPLNCAPRANAARTCVGGTCGYLCSSPFGDCDGAAGNGCEETLTSLLHCGGCDTPCNLANATSSCGTGSCVIATCDPSWEDCNGLAADGCETSMRTLTDCGGCGTACTLTNAMATCATGTCAISSCDAGFDDCDGATLTGCEASLSSPTTCGSCMTPCAAVSNGTPTCSSSTCGFTCDADFGDCNASSMDGCEESLQTSTNHCGVCGNQCQEGSRVSSVSCGSGMCRIDACESSRYADCNGVFDDGCETDLDQDDDNCGSCGFGCGSDECQDGECD